MKAKEKIGRQWGGDSSHPVEAFCQPAQKVHLVHPWLPVLLLLALKSAKYDVFTWYTLIAITETEPCRGKNSQARDGTERQRLKYRNYTLTRRDVTGQMGIPKHPQIMTLTVDSRCQARNCHWSVEQRTKVCGTPLAASHEFEQPKKITDSRLCVKQRVSHFCYIWSWLSTADSL